MDAKISRNLNAESYVHSVKLKWTIMPNGGKWNEICAWTIEHMGLPGHRYLTQPTTDHMIWKFTDIKDKLMFTIAWGDHNEL
jgi:nitrous oxidase accessory protein NosD